MTAYQRVSASIILGTSTVMLQYRAQNFTWPIHSLLLLIFLSSHSYIPWIFKKSSYTYSSFQTFPNRWYRITIVVFLSLLWTKQRVSPMFSSHFPVIPNSSACQRVPFVLPVPKVFRIWIYLKSDKLVDINRCLCVCLCIHAYVCVL